MLILRRIDDPRDSLDKARLPELLKFAADQGVEIPKQFQDKAIIIRQILRQRGLTRINIPNRVLGNPYANDAIVPDGPKQEINMAEDLMRQVMAGDAQVVPVHPSFKEDIEKAKTVPVIVELRRECKARGIPFDRKDKAADLRAKLNGKQDAA